MNKDIESYAFEIGRQIADKLDYELVETKFSKNGNENNLTFFIHKKGGITLDDCERFSKEIDVILDEDANFDESFNLNVSSLGLDRPIKTDDDLRRNLEQEIEIFFKEKNKKKVHGQLIEYNDDIIKLKCKNEIKEYSKSSLEKIIPYINFK